MVTVCTHHTQQPPSWLTRLRAHTQPIFRPRCVQLDILKRLSFSKRRGLRDGIVGSEDFKGFGVAGGSVETVSRWVWTGRVEREGDFGEGDCGGIVLGLRDDDIVEWFIAFAEAGEADFEDHCLHASILERRAVVPELRSKVLIGLKINASTSVRFPTSLPN